MYKYKKIKLPNGRTIDEHRLIMQEYLGRPLMSDEVVHHKNGDGKDNRLDNLELTTRDEHSKHHWEDGTYKCHPMSLETRHKVSLRHRGEKCNLSVLTEEMVIKIKDMISNGCRNCDIAVQFGVARNTISEIRHNKTWKHI